MHPRAWRREGGCPNSCSPKVPAPTHAAQSAPERNVVWNSDRQQQHTTVASPTHPSNLSSCLPAWARCVCLVRTRRRSPWLRGRRLRRRWQFGLRSSRPHNVRLRRPVRPPTARWGVRRGWGRGVQRRWRRRRRRGYCACSEETRTCYPALLLPCTALRVVLCFQCLACVCTVETEAQKRAEVRVVSATRPAVASCSMHTHIHH